MTDTPSSERHEIRTDTPGWDIKQRCTCGYESASKCEQWKHASDQLRDDNQALAAEISRLREALRRIMAVREGGMGECVDIARAALVSLEAP